MAKFRAVDPAGRLSASDFATPAGRGGRSIAEPVYQLGYVLSAFRQSDHYYAKELIEHIGGDAFAAVEGFLSGMVPAIEVMLTTTLAGGVAGAVGGSFFFGIGAIPGAVFGAEAGAEAGVALLTVMGIGYLLPWIQTSLEEVVSSIREAAAIAWDSRGSNQQIDKAAQQFGHARAVFARAILAALIQLVLAKGMKAASEALGQARFSDQVLRWLNRTIKEQAKPLAALAEERFVPPTTGSYTYDMVNNPGPLAKTGGALAELRASPAGNFIGGKYNEATLSRPTVLFRAQPKTLVRIDSAGNYDFNPDTKIGRWFSAEPPASAALARIDRALPDHWLDSEGNYTGTSSAETTVAVRLPAGTKVYYGPTSSQGGVLAGGMSQIQIYVPDIQSIPGLEIISETSLQRDTMSAVVDKLKAAK